MESGATETPVGEAPAPLDWAQKQKTSYCIPIWLRDLQIEASIKRVKGRIKPATETSDEPCAVVCFGPSLNDTWEAIRDFKHIISCSGAHKFLIEHGIIPNIHIEVDPRAHKVELMGPPHKDVKYLIASACHAAVFDHLEGFDVDLWHVFDNQAEAMRTLPRSEWALTGGSSVGLRAMTIARFLGFKNLHIFGMDGSAGKSGSHTTAHPNAPPSFRETVYNGVTYQTTPSMLECARGTTHEMNQMPDVVATFYGDGLVQAMMKDYKRSDAKALMPIGFSKPDLISPEYLELNRRLHRGNVFYGVGGGKHAKTVIKLAATIKEQPPSILDYGCGKGALAKELPFPIWEYDPAVEGKTESPRPADVVICADVLEHVEGEKILFVLDDLRRVTKQVGYFVIHTGPSSKTLADGRNAHILQRDKEWWTKMLKKFFLIGKILESGPLLYVVVGPKMVAKKKEKVA